MVDYLWREAVVEIGGDEDFINLIAMQRRIRRESFDRIFFFTSNGVTRDKAARDTALFFIQSYCDAWVPRPGMKEVRCKDTGVDAGVVFEALWDNQEEAAYKIYGGIRHRG